MQNRKQQNHGVEDEENVLRVISLTPRRIINYFLLLATLVRREIFTDFRVLVECPFRLFCDNTVINIIFYINII